MTDLLQPSLRKRFRQSCKPVGNLASILSVLKGALLIFSIPQAFCETSSTYILSSVVFWSPSEAELRKRNEAALLLKRPPLPRHFSK
jgi:hypothetical protein